MMLFDVNASVGKSCTGVPEFATLRERLAHMDRLGIRRAVVWNTESRSDNVTQANAGLRAELARLPSAQRRRFIPAFTISPLLQYERGGMETLRRNLADMAPACLRFTPGLIAIKLGQLEPVIRALRDLRPALIMGQGDADVQDVLAFTELFPDLRLVLTETMWPRQQHVLDLMRQRPNILMDISWLHVWGGIELMVKHCGASRILFGLGAKAHGGAAIAALAQAGISATDRELIAHGNLERLLGCAPEPAGARPAPAAKSHVLWRRLLNRQPLGVDVVDAHGHLGGSGGYVLEENDIAWQIPLALAAMRRLGIRTMIHSSLRALLGQPRQGNDELERLIAPYAGRLLGYVAFNPYYAGELVPRLDRYFAGRTFVGFKILCDYWKLPLTDKGFAPMWEFANRRRLPILIHTWGSRFDGPALLKDIVRQYPEASFLLGHTGGDSPGRAEAEALALENPNVYLEWCGSFCSSVLWEDTLQKISPRQVVFGTDAVAHGIPWELGRLLSLDVPDNLLVPILGANLRRILARRKR